MALCMDPTQFRPSSVGVGAGSDSRSSELHHRQSLHHPSYLHPSHRPWMGTLHHRRMWGCLAAGSMARWEVEVSQGSDKDFHRDYRHWEVRVWG